MIPMLAIKDSVFPVKNKMTTAPTIPNGITDRTISELLNVLNSNNRMAINPKTVMRIMVPSPPKLSWLLSSSPAAT
ncbi:hypothetical protein D9M69_592780 [compost metagenome]